MNVRFDAKSVRFRLSQNEAEQLLENRLVTSRTRLSKDLFFEYSVALTAGILTLEFAGSSMKLLIPYDDFLALKNGPKSRRGIEGLLFDTRLTLEIDIKESTLK